jgi:hypothetical protein
MISIQTKIWLERAGLLNESEDISESKLTDDQIDKILKKLKAEDEEELEQMREDFDDSDEELDELNEEVKRPTEGRVSSDTKGKLHELLVGYHLKGKIHMTKHPDKNGDTPQEAHDRLKKTVHPNDYKKINQRAKSAADHIRKEVEVDGHKIHDVHWTSQPNDILRSTGIKSSQKEDPSDLVITTHKQ